MTKAQEILELAQQLLDAAHYCTELPRLESQCREIAVKLEALAEDGEPQSLSDTIPVPRAALDWLFGEGPDADGKQFGQVEDDAKPLAGKYPRRYWWRSKFRSMIPSLTRPDRGGETCT